MDHHTKGIIDQYCKKFSQLPKIKQQEIQRYCDKSLKMKFTVGTLRDTFENLASSEDEKGIKQLILNAIYQKIDGATSAIATVSEITIPIIKEIMDTTKPKNSIMLINLEKLLFTHLSQLFNPITRDNFQALTALEQFVNFDVVLAEYKEFNGLGKKKEASNYQRFNIYLIRLITNEYDDIDPSFDISKQIDPSKVTLNPDKKLKQIQASIKQFQGEINQSQGIKTDENDNNIPAKAANTPSSRRVTWAQEEKGEKDETGKTPGLKPTPSIRQNLSASMQESRSTTSPTLPRRGNSTIYR